MITRRDFLTSSLSAASAIGLVSYSSSLRSHSVNYDNYHGGEVFLDAQLGHDNNEGDSWKTSIATMAEAVRRISKGGQINFYGKLREDGVITPQGLTDITIKGYGTRPRSGNITNNRGPKQGSANWTRLNKTSGVPLLKVTQQGWKFDNLQLQGADNSSAISLIRNAFGESEPEGFAGDHAIFTNCAFVGPNPFGICQEGGINNVKIQGCKFINFYNFGNSAIGSVNAASAGYPLFWEIVGNSFIGNYIHINGQALSNSIVNGNVFQHNSRVDPN